MKAESQSISTSSGVKGSRGCLNLVDFVVTGVYAVVAVAGEAEGAILRREHGSIEADRLLGVKLCPSYRSVIKKL